MVRRQVSKSTFSKMFEIEPGEKKTEFLRRALRKMIETNNGGMTLTLDDVCAATGSDREKAFGIITHLREWADLMTLRNLAIEGWIKEHPRSLDAWVCARDLGLTTKQVARSRPWRSLKLGVSGPVVEPTKKEKEKEKEKKKKPKVGGAKGARSADHHVRVILCAGESYVEWASNVRLPAVIDDDEVEEFARSVGEELSGMIQPLATQLALKIALR